MKKFDFKHFCEDYNIMMTTEGKHSRSGWIQISCPFCVGGKNKGHLGYNERDSYFNCWKCGYHFPDAVIKELLNCPDGECKRIIDEYKTMRPRGRTTPPLSTSKQSNPSRLLKLPLGCTFLTEQHKRYLVGRNFNPNKLAKSWNLKGTGPVGDYKFRIIAPIYFNRRLVSYVGRDITGKSDLRYMACDKEKEIIHAKRILYGYDEARARGNSIIVVEGITDVWRLGGGAVATFGITFTPEQVNLMLKFRRVFVAFDSADPQAERQGQKLANAVSAFNTGVYMVDTGTDDPAKLSQEDADTLMKELKI